MLRFKPKIALSKRFFTESCKLRLWMKKISGSCWGKNSFFHRKRKFDTCSNFWQVPSIKLPFQATKQEDLEWKITYKRLSVEVLMEEVEPVSPVKQELSDWEKLIFSFCRLQNNSFFLQSNTNCCLHLCLLFRCVHVLVNSIPASDFVTLPIWRQFSKSQLVNWPCKNETFSKCRKCDKTNFFSTVID